MPANLPPHYFEAEKRYRAAKDPADKIAALEEMLAIMPKHKGTDHLKADLRRKIARLSQSAERKAATQRASMLIDKEGAAQVVVVGLPNAGKSSLVSAVTGASPTVADYPYTTQSAIPGMMGFQNINIQLIDVPPITEQSFDWWLPHMIRRADAILIAVDLSGDPRADVAGVLKALDDKKIPLEGAKVLAVGTKLDMPGAGEGFEALKDKYGDGFPLAAVSAQVGDGLDDFRRAVYDVLGVIRVYTKAPGKKPEMDDPIILRRGSTLADAAEDVHKDFAVRLRYARIWGSGKHDGIMVKRDHVLQDGDIIELHLRKGGEGGGG